VSDTPSSEPRSIPTYLLVIAGMVLGMLAGSALGKDAASLGALGSITIAMI
jgi:hypothetical protein